MSGAARYRHPVEAFDGLDLARALPSGLAYLASGGRWRTAPHLNLLCQKLVDLEQRRITRLLVEMPPRHGKSELCSVHFPAWYLGRNPEARIILASYEATLAQTHSERARDVLHDWGPTVFKVATHPRRTRPSDWRLAGHGGRMRATGVVGGITGQGADLIIVDDPVKDAGEAKSEIMRQRTWDWWSATARSRLEPGGVCMIIQTRWHQDDLVGRIRKQMATGGEQWDSITLPGIYEGDGVDVLGRSYGEALWPWRYTTAQLTQIRDTIPEHWWNALYQQRPTPPGGSMAKDIWFPVCYALPADTPEAPVKRCRFWDCAGSQGSKGDFTVGAKVARAGPLFFIEDIIRVRYSSGEVERLIEQTARVDGQTVMVREEQEGGSSGLAVINSRRERLAGFNYRGVPTRSSKETSWIPFLIQAEAGNFKMLHGRWNAEWLAEATFAPFGEHDDQMDAVAGAFKALTLGQPPREMEFELG